jgi:hypothetical protein
VKKLARAALFGLGAGLFVAGITLGVMALLRMNVDCSALGSEECVFEKQLATSVARLQALGSVGCLLVAAGLAVGLRARGPA